MNSVNCGCKCHETSSERKYILMKPLHLRDVSIPTGTIITGPINPFWFEDNIVKVYNGNKKPLSIDDIIQTEKGADIKIEDNNYTREINIPNDEDLCECRNNEITVNEHKCRCNRKCSNCSNCSKCKKSGNCCKCCKCCQIKNFDNSNMIIFDVGEPSRVALEEKAMYETLKEVHERNWNKVVKRRSYP